MEEIKSLSELNELETELTHEPKSLLKDLDLVDSGLSEDDLKNFIAFALGNSNEVPHDIKKATTNISNKLSLGLGLTIINSLRRQISLSRKLEIMEDSLLNMDAFDSYDDKVKIELYKQVNKNLNDMSETMRKFIVQSQQSPTSVSGSVQEQLISRIMALPNDKAEEAIKLISEVVSTKEIPNAVESIKEE